MKSFFKYLLVLLSGFVILFAGIALVISIASESEPTVADNSYLYISLGGGISEYITPNPLQEMFGIEPLDLKRIRDDLEKAAIDTRIRGIVLNIGFLQTGFVKIHELQEAIKLYRQSGKKIYAYLEWGMTRDYLLAAACDSIIMPTSGNLFLTGVGSDVTHYKDLLAKVGVKAEFLHVGKYKTAPERYTHSSMSPENREVLDDILNQYYHFIIANISNLRTISKQHVEQILNDQTGLTGSEALNEKLVDVNGMLDDAVALIQGDGAKPTRISASSYARIPASSLHIRDKSRIAVINVSGVIAGGQDSNDPILGRITGQNTIVKSLEKAAKASSIKAIILRIDSPGGSAIASDVIWHAIRKATKKKPVIASISDMGASGGYYIAAGADTILTDPLSLIGSIGVFAGKFSLKGLNEKLGINIQQIKRGRNAGLFSTNTSWSPSERKVIMHLISSFYHDFVTKVGQGRHMTYDSVDQIAHGRVWTGTAGLKNGLADSAGSFYTAIALAKKMANIDSNESVRISYYPKKKQLLNTIYSYISLKNTVLDYIRQPESILLTLQNKPLTLLPYKLLWH